ncbi:MAG: hypothetical protein ACTSQP_16925 [Promethearchaeota archaeon]
MYFKNPVKKFQKIINKVNSIKDELINESQGFQIIKKQKGLDIIMDGVRIAIDSWSPKADIIFISHAHMDHIPSISKSDFEKINNSAFTAKFLCSKITREIASKRTQGKFNFPESAWLLGHDNKFPASVEYKGITFTLLENGHTYGSNSLLIEGSKKILFTSDFVNYDFNYGKESAHLYGLKPIKCDYLITECTFGIPLFSFPSLDKIYTDLRNYINECLENERPVILLAYAFGKGQKLLNFLDGFNRVLLDRNIAQNTKILESNNIEFADWEPYGNYNKRKLVQLNDYILIAPPYSMFKDPYKTLIEAGAAVILLSGKVFDKSYCEQFPADLYMPFSDHCDFNGLLNYIDACKPSEVFIEHGRIEEFSYYLANKYNHSCYILR